MESLIQQLFNGVVSGAICALLACGINLIYAETRMLWFAYAAMPALGSLLALSGLQLLQYSMPALDDPLQALAAVGVAALPSAALSWWLGTAFWQRLRDMDRVTGIAASIAAGFVITTLSAVVWGRTPMPFPDLFQGEPFEVGGALIARSQLAVVTGTTLILGTVAISREKARALVAPARAARERVGMAFALAGLLSAAAGTATGILYASVHVYPGMLVLTAMFAACIGGLGNFYGAIGASMLLGIATSLGASWIGDLTGGILDSRYQDLFPILLFVVYCSTRQGAGADRASMFDASSSHDGLAFDRAGNAMTILAVLALLPFLGPWFDIGFRLRPLTVAMMTMAIVLAIACASGRARMPDPGFMVYPMLGSYIYALLASDQLSLLVDPDLGAQFPRIPTWVALASAPLATVALAAALYHVARRWPVEYGVLLSLAAYEALRLFINMLDSPYNITNGPQGINLVRGLTGADAGSAPPMASYYIGLLFIAAIFLRMTARRVRLRPPGRNLRKTWYIGSAAIGGLAGALAAAANGFVSPVDFPSDLWVYALAIIAAARGGTVGRLLVIGLGFFVATDFGFVSDAIQLAMFGQVKVEFEIVWQLIGGFALLALTVFPLQFRRADRSSRGLPG